MRTIEDSIVFAIFPKASRSRAHKEHRSQINTRFVVIEGRTLKLSRTEYRLLKALASHPGKTINHSQLYKKVFPNRIVQNDHQLRMYIYLLRCRIELNPAKPRYLITVHKHGYRLALCLNNTPDDFSFISINSDQYLSRDQPQFATPPDAGESDEVRTL